MPKNAQTTIQLHSSHASKVMLKILQAKLKQYVNHELPDVQAGFRKGRGTWDQIANIHWITEKAREFQKKNLLLLYWLHQSLWLCGSQQTLWKILKEMEYQTTWLPLEKSVCRSGSKVRTGHGQFSFHSQRKAMPKNAQTTTQLQSSHMLVK